MAKTCAFSSGLKGKDAKYLALPNSFCIAGTKASSGVKCPNWMPKYRIDGTTFKYAVN